MDKESRYLFQLIDCNCNDCKFMVRDFDKWNKSRKNKIQQALDAFNSEKERLIEKSNQWRKKGESEKADQIVKEVSKMKFEPQINQSINYGNCVKLNKPVSFIPDTCQIETQKCFEHRKQNTTNRV